MTAAKCPILYIDHSVPLSFLRRFIVLLDQVNAALAEVSVIHNKIFLESFWADLDEVMTLKDCEVSVGL